MRQLTRWINSKTLPVRLAERHKWRPWRVPLRGSHPNQFSSWRRAFFNS